MILWCRKYANQDCSNSLQSTNSGSSLSNSLLSSSIELTSSCQAFQSKSWLFQNASARTFCWFLNCLKWWSQTIKRNKLHYWISNSMLAREKSLVNVDHLLADALQTTISPNTLPPVLHLWRLSGLVLQKGFHRCFELIWINMDSKLHRIFAGPQQNDEGSYKRSGIPGWSTE